VAKACSSLLQYLAALERATESHRDQAGNQTAISPFISLGLWQGVEAENRTVSHPRGTPTLPCTLMMSHHWQR